MSMRRRSHQLLAVVFASSAALMAAGCSSSADPTSGPDTTGTQVSDAVALDGVRLDVRRDPG